MQEEYAWFVVQNAIFAANNLMDVQFVTVTRTPSARKVRKPVEWETGSIPFL